MSNPDEEEFKIEQNHKKFSIIISIQEEQLSLILIILSNRPKKFSGFFSLNELRISSKIFQHTTTLFEAKEIIKRTVIKKQLLIDDDEFKAKITFDTGLGYDSIPFPIILFRDSDDKGPRISTLIKKYDNNDNFKDCEDNLKKSFINKLKKNNTTFIQNNIPVNGNNNNVLRASIGNNVNNKILNNVNSNGNIQFNNSMKVLTSSKIFSDNNINNNTRNPILQNNKKLMYKEVDLKNNNLQNGSNNKNINTNKDFLSLNNNILYNIYNNMNNNNNVNSSFYRDLSRSFTNINNQNILNNNNSNILTHRIGGRNIDNNLCESNIKPYENINKTNFINTKINTNINTLNIKNQNNNLLNYNNITNNNNIPKPIQHINQNLNNKNILQNNSPKYIQNIRNPAINPEVIPKPVINATTLQQAVNNPIALPNPVIIPRSDANPAMLQKPYINPGIVINNQSFHTAPIQKNFVKIPNMDSRINQNVLFEDDKGKTENIRINNNIKLSKSDEEEENNTNKNIEEYSQGGEGSYRFKNLSINRIKKVKDNSEKFQKNQYIGDYKPEGTKFVSYLKFPDTKKIPSNNSLTISTISSSITSSSNRVIGIEKNIIKHPGELDEISSRIQRILSKKIIKYRVLFRSNIDGDLASTFHEKCDKIKNTLILIKASANKRFGGFTTQTWDGEDINKKDENCFIFSIDKMKVYDIIEGQNAINCNPDLGPVFINQIKLLDQFFTQGGTTGKKGKNFKTLEDFEITEGAEKFGVKEVEVYQIY